MACIPAGKLPPDRLADLLRRHVPADHRVLVGPGIGIDAAVLDLGDRCLVAKTDPITYAADRIGWYAVSINANDVASCGARPRWFLVTVLLPECALVSRHFGLDPWSLLASGALLIAAEQPRAAAIVERLRFEGIPAEVIGRMVPADEGCTIRVAGQPPRPLPTFPRDEIVRLFERPTLP